MSQQFKMNKSIGILGQIMTLLVMVAVVMSTLLLFNIATLSNMLENQHNQAMAGFRQERVHEETMITTTRDEKIDMITTIMQMTTPEQLLTFDIKALEVFAKTFTRDPDVRSVTFLDEKGDYMAGDREPAGSKVITRAIELDDKMLGSIVVGVSADQLQNRLDEVDKRISAFENNARQFIQSLQDYQQMLISIMVVVFVIILLVAILVVKSIIGPIGRLTQWTKNVANGNLDTLEVRTPGNEIGELNANFRLMVDILRDTAREKEKVAWMATGQSGLDARMRGDLTLAELAGNIISFVAKYVQAPLGTLFIKTDDNVLEMAADFGANLAKGSPVRFEIGEGLVGQAARTGLPVCINDVPDKCIAVVSGLGEAKPGTIYLVPCVFDNEVKAVLEIASFSPFSETETAFLEQAATSIAITINMAQARALLKESSKKASPGR